MRQARFRHLWLLGLFCALIAAPVQAEEEVVLSGTPTTLVRTIRNLMREMSKPEPTFAPEDVNIRFHVLDVGRLELPPGSPEHYLDRETPMDRFQSELIRLEGMLGRRVPVSRQRVPQQELDRLEREFDDSGRELWPLVEQVKKKAGEISEDGEFQGRKFRSVTRVLWDSVRNPGNLSKAVLRFAINSTLVGFALHFGEGLTPGQAAMLSTAGGGGSFALMAGNDLYKAYLASPFWTKLPTASYMEHITREAARTGNLNGLKRRSVVVGTVKDALIISGYVGYITLVASAVGVGPESLAQLASDFTKSVGLSMFTETSFNLTNAGLTQRAIEKLQLTPDLVDIIERGIPAREVEALSPEKQAKLKAYKKILNRSGTAAMIQSPIVTVPQILATLGNPVAQGALVVLGGLGLTSYYVFVLAPEDSAVGRFREKVLIPLLTQPRTHIKAAVQATTQWAGRQVRQVSERTVGAFRSVGKACSGVLGALFGRAPPR